jgi:hypothetical protein
MARAQPTFHLDWFEFIPTTPRHALLRVRGRWEADPGSSHAAPHLLAERRGRTHRFAPLDPAEAWIAPRPNPEPWRAAFAIPLDVVEDRDAQFSLEVADGLRVSLPAPTKLGESDTEPGAPTD